MDSSLIAVVIGALIATGAFAFAWSRRHKANLFDVFIVAIGFYFGVHTMIDALLVGTEHMDSAVVLFTLLDVFLVLTVLVFLSLICPAWWKRELSLARLAEDWLACPAVPLAVVLALLVGFRLYTISVFGAYLSLSESDLLDLEQSLPYWYTAVGIMAQGLAIAAGLAAFARALRFRGSARALWTIGALGSLVVLFGIGRRALFAALVVLVWYLVHEGAARGHRVAWMALAALSAPFFVLSSNLYQTYRGESYRGVVLANVDFEARAARTSESVLEGILDFEKTVSDLEARGSVWRYNYEILNAHGGGAGELSWGRLLAMEIPNYVPRLFWPDKEISDAETETVRIFNLDSVDWSGNMIAFTYADFGFLNVLVAPLLIMVFGFACAWMLRRLTDPFLRMVLMGLAINYALNVETSYAPPIQIARDFLLVAALYCTLRGAIRALLRPRRMRVA